MKETHFATDKNKLTVIRTFDAPVDLVWRAWTEAELLDQWWAPKPWVSKTKSMDFKEGGKRLYVMVGPEGEEHWGVTTYESIKPLVSLSGGDAFSDSKGNVNSDFPIATFKNQYEEKIDHTEVTIVTEYASEEQLKQIVQMGMKEGLSMAFDNLDGVLQKLNS